VTGVLGPLADIVVGGAPDDDHGAILDAALEAFLDFGIRRTTMGEIARRSGVSAATLYRRFPGKDEVVWAVGRREARRLIERVDAAVDVSAPAREQIVTLSVACMREIRANLLLQRLLATEPETVVPLLTVHGGPVLDLGRAYLSEVISRLARLEAVEGEGDTEAVAEILARLTLSLALLPESRIPFDDDVALRAFASRHLAGLLGWRPG
jgi:AcrR family transcriptional regulator